MDGALPNSLETRDAQLEPECQNALTSPSVQVLVELLSCFHCVLGGLLSDLTEGHERHGATLCEDHGRWPDSHPGLLSSCHDSAHRWALLPGGPSPKGKKTIGLWTGARDGCSPYILVHTVFLKARVLSFNRTIAVKGIGLLRVLFTSRDSLHFPLLFFLSRALVAWPAMAFQTAVVHSL